MGYSYAIGSTFTCTSGTASITSGSASITGGTTHFDTELRAGDYVTVAGQTRIIDHVDSATLAWVTENFTISPPSTQYVYRVRLMNVETDLGLPAPRGIYTPYAQPVTLGSGAVRGAGWKLAEWRWGFLTRAQRDVLRAYCAGASAEVYIQTRTVDGADAYGIYRAWMVWPPVEEPQAGRRLEFALRFQGLTAWPA